MSVIHVSKENFQEAVLNNPKPVILDFWAPWCGPCRMVGPILDEIAEEHPEIAVCKVNVDENPDLAAEYRVSTIPTLMAIKDGQILSRSAGARPKAQILSML